MTMLDKKNYAWYIGNFSLPDKNAASIRALSNAKLFKSVGLNCQIVSTSVVMHRALNQIDGIKCWTFKSFRWGVFRLFSKISNLQTLRFLFSITSKNDVLILYNSSCWLILTVFILAKIRNSTFVLDLTEYDNVVGLTGVWKWIKRFDTFVRMEFSWRLADGVITTSAFLTEKYKSRGCRVIELPTLQDCSKFTPPRISDDHVTRLMYSGNPFVVERRRVKERLDLLILGLSLRDKASFSLDIFGVTFEDYLAMYPDHKSLLDRMHGRVTFHGFVSHNKVKGYLSKADFQVFFRDITTANKAGFPTKLSESISAGVPAITTELDGIFRYLDAPFIFACIPGYENNILDYCLDLSRKEKNELKDAAYTSHLFHFSSYEECALEFLKNLGVGVSH